MACGPSGPSVDLEQFYSRIKIVADDRRGPIPSALGLLCSLPVINKYWRQLNFSSIISSDNDCFCLDAAVVLSQRAVHQCLFDQNFYADVIRDAAIVSPQQYSRNIVALVHASTLIL